MNKKLIRFIFTLILILSFAVPTFAESTPDAYFETVTYLDGSYSQIVTTVYTPSTRANVKSGDKTYNYYNSSNQLVWSFTVKGTFEYDGKTANAIISSCSSTASNGWVCNNKSSDCSGNKVFGNAKFSLNGVPKTISLTLTCSPSGSIS